MKIEDRLKATLSRQADWVVPSDDAWSSIERRVSHPHEHAFAARLLVTLVALSLSSLAFGGLWLAFRSSADRGQAGSGVTGSAGATEPVIADTIPVGSFPRAVVVGDGLVWVSVQDDGTSSLVVGIDPENGEIQASIPVEVAPDHLAAGFGSLWGSVEGKGGPILRIDSQQQRVSASVPVAGSYVQDIATDGFSVWAALVDAEDGSSSVARIDPNRNEIVSVVPLPRFVVDLQVFDGVLWVLDSEVRGDAIVGDGQVTRIDAATGEVLGTTDVAATGTHLAVGAGGAWVQSWLSSHSDLASGASDQLVALRLSPETGEVQGSPITVEGSFSPFGFDSEGVWFFGENSQGDGFALSRLNSQSLRVDGHIDLEYEPTDAALDVERQTVWVANYQGSVSRITLDT